MLWPIDLPKGPLTVMNFEEGHGRGWEVAIHLDDLGHLLATWKSLLRRGEAGKIEARLRRFDGLYRWFLFRAEPLRNGVGQAIRWYGIGTDIEDRKRAASLRAIERRTLEMARAASR